jgi:cytochrome c biogenesis protein
MMRAFRKALRFLESPRLATWLLVFVGAWSVVATIVPQGDTVAAWAAAHPLVEPVVRALDLHHAFSSLVFQVGVFVLAVSTALCAWRRTRVALHRMRQLRDANVQATGSLLAKHDLEIACAPGVRRSEALAEAAGTLKRLGVRTKRRGEMLSAVSPWWSVWGSPAFHWGLLAIVVVVLVGSMQRSQGLMGVPVGQTVADTPSAYGVLQAGSLHSWDRVHRSIRVDAFDEDYRAGGIDRGPTPVVSVLDERGRVLGTQHIYPNSPLQVGSLTIHPAAFGFAVDLSLLNAKAVVYGRATKLVDISEVASEGTAPLGALSVSNQGGQPQEQVIVTVPLRHDGTVWAVPALRSARLVVLTLDGKTMQDRVLKPGESIALPGGDTLRVDAVGFYARLSVVDDATIPFLYAAMALAVLGLALTVFSRQQAVLVTATEQADGARVYASVHLWRNASTTRDEIRSELSRALHANDEEDVS